MMIEKYFIEFSPFVILGLFWLGAMSMSGKSKSLFGVGFIHLVLFLILAFMNIARGIFFDGAVLIIYASFLIVSAIGFRYYCVRKNKLNPDMPDVRKDNDFISIFGKK